MAERDEFDLPLPFKGVSDDLAFGDQQPGTTREAFNARGQDPTNGRERISQRAGQIKANENMVDGGNPAIELASVVYDSRNLEYSFTPGSESQEWFVAAPSKGSVYHLATDTQGNIYITDGASSVAKLNPDGEIVWQLPLPVADKGHSIRFVYVDDLFDVYVGISAGVRSQVAQLWKVTQLPEDEIEIAWEIRPGSFIEAVKVYKDKLYTIQNDPTTRTAFVRAYAALDAASPQLAQEYVVAYPAHDFDINEAGDVFVASAFDGDNGTGTAGTDIALQYQRGPNPRSPFLAPTAVNWTPHDLQDFDRRVWCWLEAEDIGPFDVYGERADGVSIARWPDRSGKNRHLYDPSSIGLKPPTLALGGLGRRPTVRFNGTDQALVSLRNSSAAKQYADQQRTIWPAYIGSMFCTIVVCLPEKRTSGTTQAVMGQANTAGGGASANHVLIANRAAGATTPNPFSSGDMSFFGASAAGDPGAGTGGHALEASFDNLNDAAIVVILWDGGIDPGDPVATRCLFQMNGKPIDRFEGRANQGLGPTIVGAFPGIGCDTFSGDIAAIFTLDRRDRQDDATEPKVLTHSQLETGSPDVDQGVNELTQLVGYFAHKYGLQHLLPKETEAYTHPYGAQTDDVPPGAAALTDTLAGPPDDADAHLGPHARTQRSWPLLAKYSPAGELVWVCNSEVEDPGQAGTGLRGVGWGVRVDKDGNLFSIGEDEGIPYINTPSAYLRKIIDQGTTFSVAPADGAWGVNFGEPSYSWPRMATDKFGNVYVSVSTSSFQQLRIYKGSDGTLLSTVALTHQPFSAAIDPRIPEYEGDLTDELARFVYVATNNLTEADMKAVRKLRLVQESPLEGSPRTITHLAVSSAGAIRRFDLASAMVEPAGASGALQASPIYVQAVPAFSKIYITDGVSKIQVYDPREDTVAPLVSSRGGEPPHGAKLLALWRGRLFAARAPGLIGGAFDWSAARIGEPTDWDNFPPERDSAAAIAGENEYGPGACPDIINTLIPIDDDFLIFGCDHSIYMLSGDPGEGGQFDLVSDVWGIAFGRPWCKDPEGNVWWIGSRGGLFVYRPGARPERVSERSIDARLARINFQTHYVRLAWNDEDKGLHIMRFPFGGVPFPDPVEHWFWDRKRMAPWPDTFGTASEPDLEPTAVYTIDGDDPDDRRLLLASRDGYIRKWDKEAKDDDGQPIDFNVLIGPLAGSSARREMRFLGPRVVLASDQDGATYELYATDDPALPGSPRHIGQLNPGRNPLKRSRMRGSHCFVRIRNSVAGQRCSIEEAHMRMGAAGLKRVRETP